MISVITPVYNAESYIEACIKNVIDQGCPDVEHIIVDGGSSDQTVSVIQKYAAQYSHIVWLSEKDKGQSDAMNKGINLAKGSIIGFLNADDDYEPNTLNKVKQIFLSLAEPSLLVGNCIVWNQNNQVLFESKPKKISFFNIFKSWEAFPNNPSAYFYHKGLHSIIGHYDEDEHYVMDIDFIMRATQVAYLRYVDITFGNWRVMPGCKSFEDDRKGLSRQRQESVRAKYWHRLPWYQRLYLKYYNSEKIQRKHHFYQEKMLKLKRTVTYYFSHPSRILYKIIK